MKCWNKMIEGREKERYKKPSGNLSPTFRSRLPACSIAALLNKINKVPIITCLPTNFIALSSCIPYPSTHLPSNPSPIAPFQSQPLKTSESLVSSSILKPFKIPLQHVARFWQMAKNGVDVMRVKIPLITNTPPKNKTSVPWKSPPLRAFGNVIYFTKRTKQASNYPARYQKPEILTLCCTLCWPSA